MPEPRKAPITVVPDAAPPSDLIAIVKVKIAERETEIDNLTKQIANSEQFLNERKAQRIHTAGKLAELHEILATLSPDAKPSEEKPDANAPSDSQ